MNRKFLLCRRCGNLIELINDSGVTPICCGIDMVLLTANSTEAATEKHIPVIKRGNHSKNNNRRNTTPYGRIPLY